MFKQELLELEEALERAVEEDVKMQEADRAADLASRKQLDLLLGEKVKLAQQRAQLNQLKEAVTNATRAELYDSVQMEGTPAVGLFGPEASLLPTQQGLFNHQLLPSYRLMSRQSPARGSCSSQRDSQS